MKVIEPTIAALIGIARDLAKQIPFDGDVAIRLLDRIKAHDLDVQTSGAVRHARLVATSLVTDTSAGQVAVARFALVRVVALLEAGVAE